jgi:hypothetical protein
MDSPRPLSITFFSSSLNGRSFFCITLFTTSKQLRKLLMARLKKIGEADVQQQEISFLLQQVQLKQ